MLMRKLALWLAAIAIIGNVISLHAQQSDSEEEGQLRFRFVGPRVGNRIAAVAGVPGDPSTYYAGAASGGVWKSTDGGNRWEPVFDKQPVAAIGSLAVSRSDPSSVWAGTGEAWVIRDSDVMGNGIYKSTDAGKTWTNMGLPESGRIGRIVIHPSNPDIVFACVLGRTTGPQTRPWCFPHHRRRPTLGSRAVCWRKCWLFRPLHGPTQSPHIICRNVAGGDAYLGGIQRRRGQRSLCFPRWWNKMDSHSRARPAKGTARED